MENNENKPRDSRLSRRRFVQLCAATALGAAGLTGAASCAPSAPPSPTAKPAAAAPPAAAPAPTSAPASPQVTAPAAAPAVAKKASITYWTPLDHKDPNPRSKAESAMVDLFRKKYPNIEVNVQTVPWQVIVRQFIQAAGAGKSPDVGQISDRGLSTLVEAKAIAPLEDYVGKNWTREQKEDWLLPQNNTIFDGKKMGIYWHTLTANMLYVNKTLLDAKGLKIPKSWDELTQTTKTLTEGRVAGYVMGASKDGDAVQLTNWVIPALWSVGADWLDEKTYKVAFNNDAGARPFQWLVDMVHTHKVIPESMVSMTRDNMLDAFKTSTVAITTLASNTVASARTSAVGKNMVLAYSPGPSADKPLSVLASGKFLVIGKDSKEREAAGLFIEEQVSAEAQVINAKIATELPSRKSTLLDPWFSSAEAADMKFQLDYVQEHVRTMPYHPKYAQIGNLVAEAVQQMVASKKPIKDALAEVAKAWAAEIG